MASLYPSLSGLPNFLLYAADRCIALSFIFGVIYVRITGHDEIKPDPPAQCTSAAIAFGSSMIGFALPLSKAIAQASSVPDCILWGDDCAGSAGCWPTAITRFAADPRPFPPNIQNNAMASAIVVAAISIMAGHAERRLHDLHIQR